jgi:hypothetical protein
MPIKSFDGTTWVAFVDMCGFKQMMKQRSKVKARRALERFYKTVYNVNKLYHDAYPDGHTDRSVFISSLIVSDCAILFIDNSHAAAQNQLDAKNRDLRIILWAIEAINRVLIGGKELPWIMTKSAVAYGDFVYENRTENLFTEKNFFYGHTYLKAFFEEEKIDAPGWCRVFDVDLPVVTGPNQLSSLKQNHGFFDFYWMLYDPSKAEDFKTKYDALCDLYPRDNRPSEFYRKIGSLLHRAAYPRLRLNRNKTNNNDNK